MTTEALERQQRSLPARASSIATFEQSLGGREALVDILSQADSTKEIQDLLAWLGNPDFQNDSLAAICRMANLTAGDVFLAYERALQTRAKILARLPIAENLPKVASDAMRRAMTHKVICEKCNGRQKFWFTTKEGQQLELDCKVCDEGWINQEPTLEQQKVALELGELLQKSGLQINNTQQVDNSKTVQVGLSATLAQMQASAAKIAFTPEATAPPESVDGQVVE